MLTVYRRHREKCKFTDDRISMKCRCPLWGKGTLEGKPYQKTLKTRSFERAQQIIREIEDGKRPEEKRISVKDALDSFVKECESRNLSAATLRKYRLLRDTLSKFADGASLHTISQLDSASLRGYRDGRHLGSRSASKEIERLRAFFKFCVDNDWLQKNPAKSIKAPIVREKPVLPFTEAEVQKILSARSTGKAGAKGKGSRTVADPRTSLFIKVLLLTGLRIIDVSKLTKDRIQNGRIFLYTTKTGAAVSLPLPEDISAGLNAIPHHQIFQTPTGTQKDNSLTDYWRDQTGKVFTACGIKGHPHQFRHTMARRLLEAGASVEDVADILGNSPNIVRKHYAPWVASRQSALDARLEALWTKPKLVRVK